MGSFDVARKILFSKMNQYFHQAYIHKKKSSFKYHTSYHTTFIASICIFGSIGLNRVQINSKS